MQLIRRPGQARRTRESSKPSAHFSKLALPIIKSNEREPRVTRRGKTRWLVGEFPYGPAVRRLRSTIKSCRQFRGTEYLRSAVEYFVRSEMTTLSPSADQLSALNAITLTGVTCFSGSFTARALHWDKFFCETRFAKETISPARANEKIWH